MDTEEKEIILEKSKDFFKSRIVQDHIKNTEKLKSINEFDVNPFIHKYISNFAFGDTEPENMAKALLYPRVLGTSITTTFGNGMQQFCNEVLSSYASTTSGIDIEFIDAADGRKKYCQVKSGPKTINSNDVETIKSHFLGLIRLGRTNGLVVSPIDCVVGILYGEQDKISNNYKQIDRDYPVYAGRNFWYHLTGDISFYDDLANAFAQAAEEMDCREILEEVIEELSKSL